MKSLAVIGLALLLSFCSTGCIAASMTETATPAARQAVVVDGHVYLVNTSTGEAREIDLSTATASVPEPTADDTP